MIATVRGILIDKGPGSVIVEAGGVGYNVFVGNETYTGLPEKGMEVFLYTYLAIREDAHTLYGFSTRKEKEFFETLVGVSGIGPKSALSITNVAPTDTLIAAIATGDIPYLTKVSGIGKKTAEKIVVELRDKLSAHATEEAGASLRYDNDVVEALRALGYGAEEIRSALGKIEPGEKTANARIKEALKILAHTS